MTRSRLRQRLHGFAAAIVIVLLVVGTPLILVAADHAPWEATIGELPTLLSSPDDGTFALVAIATVAWIAWLIVTVSVAVEAVASAKGLRAPLLPGIGIPQRAMGELVAVAALLFVAAPAAVTAFPSAAAHAAGPPVPGPAILTEVDISPVVAEVAPVVAEVQTSTTTYTVKRGDSLWRIADRMLGDGARFVEIVDLNREIMHGQPDFIEPGTVLKVPVDASEPDTGRAAEEIVVEPGDTLSAIAADTLDDPRRYPEIFEASHDTVQTDGARIADPNLIRPGWKLTIPEMPPSDAEVVTPPTAIDPPADEAAPTPALTTAPSTSPTLEPRTDETASVAADDKVDEPSGSGWLLPGLTGAGAILAGSLLVAVRAHRRTQQRSRRPGHVIVPPPPKLRGVEKTVWLTGAPTANAVEQLDRLLRHLASTQTALPEIDTVELDDRSVTLHLATATTLPKPWIGADDTWHADLDATVPEADVLPPYPLLVSVGQDDAGHMWLVDLERLGSVAVTGDTARAEALATHVAAELALNPWSVLVATDVVGIASKLALLDPVRLHHHVANDISFLGQLRKELDAAQQAGFGDPDPFHAVVITPDVHQTDEMRAITEIVRGQTSRAGTAIITIHAEPEPGVSIFEVTADGRLRIQHLGLDLHAAGLTPQEAQACAAIVDLTREATTVPMPSTEATAAWRALADDAGALLGELTEARPIGPAGVGSLLPNSADAYEAMAATTTEDVAVLAPVAPTQTRQVVEETDPTLDQDLTEWLNPDSDYPKLTLLGPVKASARGAYTEIAERKPYFVEMLAYLALHPQGVSSASVAEAFSIGASRARTDLSFLRAWLAANPRTGRPHLPAANASPVYEQTGVAGYQVEDLLVDFDLFRRLRARGQARGSDGIADLQTALELVNGEPFDRLRERGWSWLLDGERLHETAACAVVDTAHIVVVNALDNGDAATAYTAAEIACHAAPYDEIARLDLAKVTEAAGHNVLAEQILRDDVFNRRDDDLPPIDLPERTQQIVKNHEWGRPRRPSKNL
ncbi:LysM peptidoglycan-binding domain-containing protein [Aeromicrobium sp.]|uniref:LysM peptidoglycan-binding domain-containing protein n=1 Tax=Aeromicrobium sp. TaxID=1871063 RepID=UPI0019A60A63|nr:LysM peptidoglycan-binding domain-containing protein [Aeromicrobium sp.]MBC7632164.1 LysM peptidoglycan-binding domain-containing protein [Aeromicrobium sp.]